MRSFFLFIFLFILFYFINQYLVKWNREGFEVSGEKKPILLWMYGKKGKDQDLLRKKFKEDYKEYVGYIDILEYDMLKKDIIELDKMKMNPQIEYEIRFYPNGLEDPFNYNIYKGSLNEDLSDYIKQLEIKQEDIVEGSGGMAALESALQK